MTLKNEKIYLTTTLPYVNGEPHLGFALELVQADVFARYQQSLGKQVFLNTGTDEHGLKLYQAAQKEGVTPQEYVDQKSARFRDLLPALGILPTANFIRTTDSHHIAAAQAFWTICQEKGFIYRKKYTTKYCVGCELEKTDSELINGFCPIHPTTSIELFEEDNYFFKFSNFSKQLLDLYQSRPDFVVPAGRLHEIKSFVEQGLQDFSISRLTSKMPWGIPVPGDSEQTMYVWFDALVNYISAIGWPNDLEKFNSWWAPARAERLSARSGGVVQFAGKDNLRQQSAMWQAMLMSVGIEPSKQIMIHGFITADGQKMSKSLGNVVNPFDLVRDYGTEAVRYYLARHVHPFEDHDFTAAKFLDAYNSGLANGLGNLVSRVMKMAEQHLTAPVAVVYRPTTDFANLITALDRYEFNQALEEIWRHIGAHDNYIQKTQPFILAKTDLDQARVEITKLVQGLADLSVVLTPFLPTTAQTIKDLIAPNRAPTQPLLPRK